MGYVTLDEMERDIVRSMDRAGVKAPDPGAIGHVLVTIRHALITAKEVGRGEAADAYQQRNERLLDDFARVAVAGVLGSPSERASFAYDVAQEMLKIRLARDAGMGVPEALQPRADTEGKR